MLRKRARAQRDFVEYYMRIAEDGGADLADRFFARCEESFNDLARHPDMGTVLVSRNPRMKGLRRWRVRDFENFLIFYLVRGRSVSIVRVLRGSQDWRSMFEVE